MSGKRKACNAHTQVSIADVKLCALCGTLNHTRNIECFTCGWRGTFDEDKRMTRLAWERLYSEFEIVQVRHVSATRSFSVDELGVAVHRHPIRRNWERVKAWWAEAAIAMRTRRGVRAGARQQPFPHNELGV